MFRSCRGHAVLAGSAIILTGIMPAGDAGARKTVPLERVLTMSDRAKARLPIRTRTRAARKFGLKAVALRQGFLKRHNTQYKVQIPMERVPHKVRDQKSSGRCWAFATDHVLESKLFNSKGKSPEISKSFINYHALRDKSRTLLKATALTEGKLSKLPNMLGEGGTQARALNIVKRHGVVPERKMPSTVDGDNSGVFMSQLKTILAGAQRSFAGIKKGPRAKAQRRKLITRYMKEVDGLLASTVGKPPRRFRINGKTFTPRTYARELGLGPNKLGDYVVLTNDPTRTWNRRYKEQSLGMASFESYNVSHKTMQNAMKKTLKGGEAIYFATNVSRDNPHRAGTTKAEPQKAQGILSVKAFNYKGWVPTKKISKRVRMKAGISPTNHAMAITGYDPGKKRGSVLKWKVDNSWGSKIGDKGHFHMYDDYFRNYATRILVPRSAVPTSLLKKIEGQAFVGAKKKKGAKL